MIDSGFVCFAFFSLPTFSVCSMLVIFSIRSVYCFSFLLAGAFFPVYDYISIRDIFFLILLVISSLYLMPYFFYIMSLLLVCPLYLDSWTLSAAAAARADAKSAWPPSDFESDSILDGVFRSSACFATTSSAMPASALCPLRCVCATSVLLHASAAPTRTTLASLLRLNIVCIPEKQNCAQLFSSFYRLCGKKSNTCRIGPAHAQGNAWGP